MKLTTIDSGILFRFIEDINSGTFSNKTSWGFEVKDRTNDPKRPRWGIVDVVGPKVKYVKPGDYILIENLQWTNALHFNNSKIWKTNEEKIIGISETAPRIN